MRIRGTDFVLFQVSDLAAAARFYREVLELPQETYDEKWQWAEFNCGDVTLSLHGGALITGTSGGGRIALSVEDIHAAYEELQKKGVTAIKEPVDYHVCWAMEVHDPDGNTVILHHRANGTFGRRTTTPGGTAPRRIAETEPTGESFKPTGL